MTIRAPLWISRKPQEKSGELDVVTYSIEDGSRSPLTLFPSRLRFSRRHTPASSAPHRSQYHSVGRLRVPQSAHFRVLATAAAALGEEVAGAGAWVSRGGALVAVDEKPPDGRRGVSSDTDFKKVSSSTSAATGSDWVGCGLGAERAGGAA